MLKPALVLLFLSFLTELSSQSVSRQSINCLGQSTHIDGGIVSETVGQPYSTQVFRDLNIFLNPGFQQKMIAFIREGEIRDNLQIQLYPNPVSEELHLVTSSAFPGAKIEIIDINGNVVFLSEQDILPDNIIHLGHLTSGIYTIRVWEEKTGKSYNARIIVIK